MQLLRNNIIIINKSMSTLDNQDTFQSIFDRNFNQIWEKMNINSPKQLYTSFLHELFKTLSYDDNGTYICDSFAINNLLNLPYPIGVRIHNMMKKKREAEIFTEEDFLTVFNIFAYGGIEEKIDFFFRIVDFNDDDIIEEVDLKMFFKHMNFKCFIKEDESTNEIIKGFFNSKTSMTYTEYKCRADENCDLILLFYFSVFKYKLIDSNILNYFDKNVLENISEKSLRKIASTSNIDIKNQRLSHLKLTQEESKTDDTIISSLFKRESFSPIKNSSLIPFNKQDKSKSAFNLDTSKKYSPTSKLFDLLNEKFNLQLSYYSPKISLDTKDDDLDEQEDLDVLCSFENDIKASFESLKKCHYSSSKTASQAKLSRKSFPYRMKQKSKKEQTKGLSCFEISSNQLSLQALQNKNVEGIIEFDNVILPNNVKIKLVIVHNFLFVFSAYGAFDKIYLLRHSYLSNFKECDKKTYKHTIILYSPNNKSFKCSFLSETMMKKFVTTFNRLNNYNDDQFDKEYKVIEEIGKGHFGHIFKVENISTHEICVEKRIRKRMPFIKEVEWEVYISQFLLTYQHPNIVKISDVILTYDTVHIIMEYVPNGSFENKFQTYTHHSYSKILTKVLSGINFLHTHGILHRDIKLENVVLNEKTREVKLIDFGLSKVLFPSEKTNECCGTVSYTAPEIFEGIRYTNKIDIWSFGIMAYILEFKKLPFETKEFKAEVILGEMKELFKLIKEKDSSYWEKNSLRKIIYYSLVRVPSERINSSELLNIIYNNDNKN